MTADLRIISYLNRALTHELVAVQQYLAQAKLTALWDMAEVSQRLSEDVAAELRHASSLMEELLLRGVAPASAALTPTRLADDLLGLLRHDRVLEVEAVRLYEEAARYCARIRDERCHALFAKILSDEVEHIQDLDEWMRSLRTERAYA